MIRFFKNCESALDIRLEFYKIGEKRVSQKPKTDDVLLSELKNVGFDRLNLTHFLAHSI